MHVVAYAGPQGPIKSLRVYRAADAYRYEAISVKDSRDETPGRPAGIYTFSIGLSSISDDGNGQVVQFNVSGL